MSRPTPEPIPPTRWSEAPSKTVVSGPLVVWLILLALLAVNVIVSFLPLGGFKIPLNLAVAGVQVSLMGVVFMRLNRASPLVRLTAAAGFLWMSLLFIFATTDYLTRP